MYEAVKGKIIKVLSDNPDLQELLVEVDGQLQRAYHYSYFQKMLAPGQEVLLNISAVKLGLGTGGRHFVIPTDPVRAETSLPGHIMKLRYTPWQFPVLAVEEEASPFHEQLENCTSLAGTPVVAASLHSMIPGIILGFRSCFPGHPKIVYVMTDGAALPIALSNLVRELKKKELLQGTVTAGHAFGGDLEAVSIPSALVAAVRVLNADLVVCGLGPGIVGTGTALGFSGIEQSWIIDLTSRLQGIPVFTPRISTADERKRHYGLSHHSVTVLNLANQPALVGLSKRLPEELLEEVSRTAADQKLGQRHHWYAIDDPPVEQLFEAKDIRVKSMGRKVADDPWFFQTSVSAGMLAALAATDKLDRVAKLEMGNHGV